MANEKSGKETGSPNQPAGQPKIVWDDSNMRSAYANVVNVAGGLEEIVLLFGINQSWQAGQEEVKVKLSDRIVLSPFAAKRLAVLLNNVLKNYESQYGKLEVIAKRPEGATVQ